jgi:hypothetical protein
MPTKRRKAKLGEESRRALEGLRADCRRHPERPVPLECTEGPRDARTAFELAVERGMFKPVAWGSSSIAEGRGEGVRFTLGQLRGDPEHRALALLVRLGELARRHPELIGAELPALAARPSHEALGALLVRGCVEPDESSVPALRVWQVPDVLAAIAAFCDKALELAGSSSAAVDCSFAEPCDKDAMLLFELEALEPEARLKGRDIARRIGVKDRWARELVERLRAQGWPIESKGGASGGSRLVRGRLTPSQQEWLERSKP